MSVTVRALDQNDFQSVREVAQASWHDTYDGILPRHVQDAFLIEAYNDYNMQQRLMRGGFWVAEDENGIIGFSNFTPVNEQGDADLVAIYMHPDHIGQGIGSMLLQTGIQQLMSLRYLYVDVEKENEVGMRFYEAKGFKVVKEFDEVFAGHTLSTVRMVLELEVDEA
ncbi:GNAT family N-acetyltransferase [Alkalibacillus salilacus]|uniref:Ribosomal protein S18 acetylase RimI-like enzyme n=1 Tax=Alkalibacillus salilacus TaxID=284582 RepID=A0ABT9VGZ4_9BACI|nr:GNAT family N-acetyltransferase [Alkalibacillus salilacus]MDQ0160233.1 ribosomal protein S18 acetylase RimI-like enzyme [Alkalibacillus salilacus]